MPEAARDRLDERIAAIRARAGAATPPPVQDVPPDADEPVSIDAAEGVLRAVLPVASVERYRQRPDGSWIDGQGLPCQPPT